MVQIKLEGISKTYGKNQAAVHALKNVTLQIEKGESVAVMGRSGSGKSTLLNVLGGLTTIDHGRYYFDGEQLKTTEKEMCRFRNRKIGFIVQNYALLNDKTIYENVELPLRFTKQGRKRRMEKVGSILEEVGLLDKKDRLTSEISGGECQRTAIARALVNDASVILADEPTGALDETTEKTIMQLFGRLNREGKTVVIVTHDPDIASLQDRIIRIRDGEVI
ncbi:MAG TPA: peptide ABC transporter ATP-binding protein [Clostridiales bacterium]|jgi:putative ABC transport system ATP-binding protein|nr:peptide ABC transporter ATP-binding protein [Clostridiales bacterium]